MALTQVPIELSSTPGIVDNSNATAITIDSSENVGIGTGSPAAKAHIYDASTDAVLYLDSANVNGSHARFLASGSVKHFVGSGGGFGLGDVDDFAIRSFDNLIFATNNSSTERMRINSSGNVGIGTSSPLRGLDLRTAASGFGNVFLVDTASGTTGTGGGVIFGSDDGQGTDVSVAAIQGIKENSNAGDQRGALVFATKDFSLGNLERMRIDSNGNLFVGTTSTSASVSGGRIFSTGRLVTSVNNEGHYFRRNSSDGAIVDFAKDSTSVGSINVGSGNVLAIGQGSTYIQFHNALNSFYASDGSGGRDNAIDIGASGVRFKDLYLSGGVNLGGPSEINASIAYLRSSSTTTSSLTLRKASSSADAVDFVQCRNDANTAKLVIEGSGDIKNTNNSYGAISDEKLKENIVDATSQWDDIKAVRVRKYSLKEDGLDAPNMLGVVAQELESAGMNGLVSESVDRNEDNANLGTVTKSVNYSILYMKAVKALQEAMVRIESLEAEVSALKGE